MITKRSFFRKLAQAAGIVALAPQLAFRLRPKLPEAPKSQVLLWQTSRGDYCVSDSFEKAMREGFDSRRNFHSEIPSFLDFTES